MKKSALLSLCSSLALLSLHSQAGAALIYGFNDSTLDGFTGNAASVSLSTTTGKTEGAGALDITTTRTQTYGGAVTSNVPANFYNATSFSVDVTITQTPTDANGAAVYFDLVPVFFSTDGEIDPDLTDTTSFINLGGLAPGTYHYTLNLAAYYDPDGVLVADATPGAIIAADAAYDAANGKAPNAITGFQLTSEHGVLAAGQSANIYVDNVTVAPEPASLGLLAAGGLLMGRRRRV